MVGRLIEQQHLGLRHQGLRQRHALFGTARQRADNGLGIQMQALQGFGHALLPIPSVQRLNFALHGVQVAVALGVLVNQVAHTLQAFGHRIEDAGGGVELRLLRHVGNAGVALHLHQAVVGLFQPGQDLEHRRFARAVAPDQSDAFGAFQ